MKADISVNDSDGIVNMSVSFNEGIIGKNLTPDDAEKVVDSLRQWAAAFCLKTLMNWLLEFKRHDNTILVDGESCRLKCTIGFLLL